MSVGGSVGGEDISCCGLVAVGDVGSTNEADFGIRVEFVRVRSGLGGVSK